MASSNRGYWSRSWELLTRDEGWFKPLLVLAAARLVPIVGPFGADGYGLEWARLTAWGVDSSPKQKNVDVGACIKTGARAFVVGIGYACAFAAIRFVLSLMLGDVLGGLLGMVVILAAAVLTLVAKLRATIYQSISAGYQVERIYDMVKRDYKGLLRILGLIVTLGLAFFMLASMLYGAALLTKMTPLVRDFMDYERYGYADDWVIINSILSVLASALPVLFVMTYILGVVKALINLIVITAVGLWMRQFDVAHWGESSDPLPFDAPSPSSGYSSPAGGYTTSSVDPSAYSQSYDSSASAPAPAPAPAPASAPASAADACKPTAAQVDESVTTFPIPVPVDDFPQSSEEMDRMAEINEAAQAWAMSAAEAVDITQEPSDVDVPEFIESMLQDLEDDQDVQEALDSLDRLVDVTADEEDAAKPVEEEQKAFDDVPMFSLADAGGEPEPDALADAGREPEPDALADAGRESDPDALADAGGELEPDVTTEPSSEE